MLGASPQAAEASVNTTKPVMNTRLAPARSLSAPAVRISAANATVYALTTHCSELTPPPSDSPIGLIATFTTLTSSCTTAKPRLVASSVQRRAARSCPAAAGPLVGLAVGAFDVDIQGRYSQTRGASAHARGERED